MPYSICLRMVIYHQWYILFTGRYRLYSILVDKPESSRQHYAHYANLWLRLTMGYIMIYPGAFSCLIGNWRFSHVLYGGFHKWWYPHSWMVYNGKIPNINWWLGDTPISGKHPYNPLGKLESYTPWFSTSEFIGDLPIVLTPGYPIFR